MAGTSTDKRTDACSRPLCYTLKLLAYKKRQKHEKKITLFPMQLFNVVNTMFLRKNFFLAHKNLKKTPSKAANNQPKPFISQSSPAYSPELIFHIIKCREQASVLLSVTQNAIEKKSS